jgi:hypothetical protein
MCDVLLPPGVNPTAVKYIYHIKIIEILCQASRYTSRGQNRLPPKPLPLTRQLKRIRGLLLVHCLGLRQMGEIYLLLFIPVNSHNVSSCVPLLDPDWRQGTTLRQTSILRHVTMCLKKFQEREKYSWMESFFRLRWSFMGVWFLSSCDGPEAACLPCRNE